VDDLQPTVRLHRIVRAPERGLAVLNDLSVTFETALDRAWSIITEVDLADAALEPEARPLASDLFFYSLEPAEDGRGAAEMRPRFAEFATSRAVRGLPVPDWLHIAPGWAMEAFRAAYRAAKGAEEAEAG
jgi:hypothetical protein